MRSSTRCVKSSIDEDLRERSNKMSEQRSEYNAPLADFYREHILPIAEQAEAEGLETFPLGPDVNENSYFIHRKTGESYVHQIDHTNLQTELSRLWENDVLSGMGKLPEPIIQLAEQLREKEVESDDISPFIYAMF